MGFADKIDRCACRIAVSACSCPANLSASKQTICVE